MEWFRHTRRNQSVQTSEKICLSKKLETRNSSVFQPCQQLLVLAALHHLPLCSPWVGRVFAQAPRRQIVMHRAVKAEALRDSLPCG